MWTVRDPNGPDAGVADKRLLVAEPEFVSVLKQTQREINTLSPYSDQRGTVGRWRS